ncbi:hypothetical protein SAMN05216464_113137 [Mucilaginibacter pineti]|uniref:Sporulation related domain-containing protein n=1 Tax=Mucilaginibacter pineti TaxID=1391627 RepID=A0A1G7IRK3_9SPHI|nr:hypothetical protein [Mucilaginibacter pineti]SDF15362.1 hypothetical protein SAMN05216464_113137 [Mucilaginibacter pineti]
MKRQHFWGYPWLCLCLVFSACSTMRTAPVSQNWVVEARLISGIDTMSFSSTELPLPVWILEADHTITGVFYRTADYSAAVRIQNALANSGLVTQIKLIHD